MQALPLGRLGGFQAFLRERWFSACVRDRRGAVACSLGLNGLRWAEVRLVRIEDVEVDVGELFVRTAKRGSPRRIPVAVELLRAVLGLRETIREGLPVDHLFLDRKGNVCDYQSVRRFVEMATKRVFGRRFSFHCFRHTAAVEVYRRTGDVLAVQRFLGHRSLKWTEAYLRTLTVVDVGGPVVFNDRRGDAPGGAGGAGGAATDGRSVLPSSTDRRSVLPCSAAGGLRVFDPEGLAGSGCVGPDFVGGDLGRPVLPASGLAGPDAVRSSGSRFGSAGPAGSRVPALGGDGSSAFSLRGGVVSSGSAAEGSSSTDRRSVSSSTDRRSVLPKRHSCREHLMPFRGRKAGWVLGVCDVCGSRWEWPAAIGRSAAVCLETDSGEVCDHADPWSDDGETPNGSWEVVGRDGHHAQRFVRCRVCGKFYGALRS